MHPDNLNTKCWETLMKGKFNESWPNHQTKTIQYKAASISTSVIRFYMWLIQRKFKFNSRGMCFNVLNILSNFISSQCFEPEFVIL